MNLSARQSQRPRLAVVDEIKIPCVSVSTAQAVMIQRSCSYINLRYLLSHQQLRQVFMHFFFSVEKGIASDYHQERHTSTLHYFNEVSHSHVRGFLAGTTPVLLSCMVFSFFVSLVESIGSIQSAVAENPHHN